MDSAIIVALISSAGAVAGAFVAAIYNLKAKRLEQQNKELQHHFEGVEFVLDLQFFNLIRDNVERLLEQTNADRFIILFGTNGKTEFGHVTAIYEQHKHNAKLTLSIGASRKYVRFAVDAEYRAMLKRIEVNSSEHLELASMPAGCLRDIYEAEQVTVSSLYFVARIPKDQDNDILLYASVASHTAASFTKAERSIHKSCLDAIRAGAQRIPQFSSP